MGRVRRRLKLSGESKESGCRDNDLSSVIWYIGRP
jgi:hypothetical protein